MEDATLAPHLLSTEDSPAAPGAARGLAAGPDQGGVPGSAQVLGQTGGAVVLPVAVLTADLPFPSSTGLALVQ